MAKKSSRGTGRGGEIVVNPEVITSIYNQLQRIIVELDDQALPAIKQLGRNRFYEAGKAEEAMAAYADANEKFNDLLDNYVRASTLVIDVLNTMIETDEAIAQRVIAALEV